MREGGAYVVDKPGQEPRLVERTEPHPDGAGGPRDPKGVLQDRPGATPETAERAAEEASVPASAAKQKPAKTEDR